MIIDHPFLFYGPNGERIEKFASDFSISTSAQCRDIYSLKCFERGDRDKKCFDDLVKEGLFVLEGEYQASDDVYSIYKAQNHIFQIGKTYSDCNESNPIIYKTTNRRAVRYIPDIGFTQNTGICTNLTLDILNRHWPDYKIFKREIIFVDKNDEPYDFGKRYYYINNTMIVNIKPSQTPYRMSPMMCNAPGCISSYIWKYDLDKMQARLFGPEGGPMQSLDHDIFEAYVQYTPRQHRDVFYAADNRGKLPKKPPVGKERIKDVIIPIYGDSWAWVPAEGPILSRLQNSPALRDALAKYPIWDFRLTGLGFISREFYDLFREKGGRGLQEVTQPRSNEGNLFHV